LAHAVSRLVGRRPVLLVTPDSATADQVVAELAFWLGPERALLLPADDVRPYESASPHPRLERLRLAALDALRRKLPVAVVAPARALCFRVLRPGTLAQCPVVAPKTTLDPDELAGRLADLGYLGVPRVEDPGTFSRRGDLLEVWPTGAAGPARIELFDDEVELLRGLDPGTRRSTDHLDEIRLLPAREVVLGAAALRRAGRYLADRVDELGYGRRRRQRVLRDLGSGIRFAGCEDWLPALHELAPVLEHARHARLVVLEPARIRVSLDRFEEQIQQGWRRLDDRHRPLVHPEHRYVPPQDVLAALEEAVIVESVVIDDAHDLSCRDNQVLAGAKGELATAAGCLGRWLEDGWRVGLVVGSRARAERLEELLLPHGLQPTRVQSGDVDAWPPGQLVLHRGDLPRGFHSEAASVAVVTADELLGAKLRVQRAFRSSSSFSQVARQASAANFGSLNPGDLVVHQRHGIGRFVSIASVDVGAGPQELVQLEYRGGDRFYLPVWAFDQLSPWRSAGEGRAPRLDRLGGETWEARKRKVRERVLRLAHELIRVEAERRLVERPALIGTTPRYRAFEQAFPYEETPDQLGAIESVLADLAKPVPMDHLVVGDVGFGKTEVALRAAMRVIEAGRQVALLCPTTVLAFQHARTLRERFEAFDVSVGVLSRFSSGADRKQVLSGLKTGDLQVVVGTTQLLGRAVRFADLGLVVLDEEHRFGVKQKERFKRMRTSVDVLSLSATPIPRTLHMALSGIRSFSMIATPPVDRLPVRTSLHRWDDHRVRDEILRELKRGGQVFFVHNRVASIEVVARAVRELVPEADVRVAHGQMDDSDLEEVLVDFVEQRFSVLVCTAIIESGVDMPNVNTILVNRADQFGLAQLYQLRGRVGRSHRRGYCALLVEEGAALTPDATRRLQVLVEHTQLGSGFAVASADLDQRGAGDLLGESQHGHIQAVGFETWVEILEDAMAEARGSSERDRLDPEVELPLTVFLPESYLPDLEERILWYRRLALGRSLEEVRALGEQLEREHGELPDEAHHLVRLLEIKARCRGLGIARCAWLKVRAAVVFSEHTPLSSDALARFLERHAKRVRMSGDRELSVRFSPNEAQKPVFFLHWLLGELERALKPA